MAEGPSAIILAIDGALVGAAWHWGCAYGSSISVSGEGENR
jgi:hypothetical protein